MLEPHLHWPWAHIKVYPFQQDVIEQSATLSHLSDATTAVKKKYKNIFPCNYLGASIQIYKTTTIIHNQSLLRSKALQVNMSCWALWSVPIATDGFNLIR